ncbi:hypothetical protein DIPPA_28724 [Diplonema papillatum]|nr:hypothetical protein DIPPA_28724 [Diplonema papillatum]
MQPPVVALDFSRDNKYLATVTDPPDPYIYLWQLDKQRLAGMAEVHHRISQISVSPWAHWELCTTGTSFLRLWRAQGNQLRAHDPLARHPTEYRFTCHSWFDSDKLVVGTAEGVILVFDNQELKRTIADAHGPGRGISCLHSVSRGFVSGGDEGILALFERSFDSDYFNRFKLMTTPERVSGPDGTARVIDVTISPGEESVVCCYDNNEVAQIDLNLVESIEEGDRVDKHNAFKRLPIGFHNDVITGIDVCVQRSVIVTASLDRHVRLWNFLKKRVEVDKKFDDDALSVALHPSGLLLAVGFRYKLCVFVVLTNDLMLCHEFPGIKQCREVKFSHGGQYFAAIGNPWCRISVFNTYTFQPLTSKENPGGVPLTGHSAAVQSIWWSHSDQMLISAGSEGAIYEWKVTCGKRNEANESVTKNVMYHCVRYDDDSQTLAALGTYKPGADRSDGKSRIETNLRTFRFQTDYPPKTAQKVLSTPIKLPTCHNAVLEKSHRQPRVARTCPMAISSLAQTLFVGTSEGSLLLFEWPPTDDGGETPQPYSHMEVHQGEISFVVLSLDERHLFTVGEDRCLYMFDVDVIVDGRPVARKPFPYASFESIALISQNDFDERARIIAELKSTNEELTRRQEAELLRLEEEHRVMLKKVDEETELELQNMRQEMERSVAEAQQAKVQAQERETKDAEAHMKAAEELEALHTRKVEAMQQKQKLLQAEKNDLTLRYENKLHKLQAEIRNERKGMDQQKKELEQRLSSDLEQLRAEIRETDRDINGMIDMTIQDYMTELEGGPGVEGLHEKWKAILLAKESQSSQMRTNTALFKTRREKHDKEIEELENQIDAKKEQERLLAQKAHEHMKTNEALKSEISQRNETISASERKILDLKKQAAELEKLRYVLTFKFAELRKEVAPKEEKIRDMGEAIQHMDLKLEGKGTERNTLERTLAEKDEQISSLMQELGAKRRKLEDKQRGTDQMLRDLTSLIATMDPQVVEEGARKLVENYSLKQEEGAVVASESLNTAEFARQRQYIRSELASVGKAARSAEGHLRKDNQSKTEENVTLVAEINELRAEKKQLSQRHQATDSLLKELQAQLQRAIAASTMNSQQSPSRPFSAPPAASSSGRVPAAAKLHASQEQPAKGLAGRSPAKGKLVKGSTRSLKELSDMNPQKLAAIVVQVEQTNSCIRQQGEEISRLKAYVKQLLQGAEEAAGEVTTSRFPAVDGSQNSATMRPLT